MKIALRATPDDQSRSRGEPFYLDFTVRMLCGSRRYFSHFPEPTSLDSRTSEFGQPPAPLQSQRSDTRTQNTAHWS